MKSPNFIEFWRLHNGLAKELETKCVGVRGERCQRTQKLRTTEMRQLNIKDFFLETDALFCVGPQTKYEYLEATSENGKTD